jgi:hypothetical protein
MVGYPFEAAVAAAAAAAVLIKGLLIAIIENLRGGLMSDAHAFSTGLFYLSCSSL